MARGTANGEPVVSQANSKEFDAGYARIFGDRKPQRGRWIWDEAKGKMVAAEEYVPPAARIQIDVDRHYENLSMTDKDGEKIVNSRRQHREFLKSRGLALADDFKGVWQRKKEEREKIARGDFDHKARREAIGRAVYKLEKP